MSAHKTVRDTFLRARVALVLAILLFSVAFVLLWKRRKNPFKIDLTCGE